MSKTKSLRSTLDQTRNICNNKTAILQIHHAKIRIQRSKMIICDFGLCIGYPGKECGFSDIWKTDKSNICDNLQFQNQI